MLYLGGGLLYTGGGLSRITGGAGGGADFAEGAFVDGADNDFPIGGRGGISPICAAAAANKSASVIEPNFVEDFLFDGFSGSG